MGGVITTKGDNHENYWIHSYFVGDHWPVVPAWQFAHGYISVQSSHAINIRVDRSYCRVRGDRLVVFAVDDVL